MMVALAAAGCDSLPLLAPTDSTVTLTTASKFVPIGGSTQVTAFVAESSGTPVQNGTTVRFTANLGRVEPVEALTTNGYAVATFLAGDASGVADVRATSGAVGGSVGEGEGASSSNVVQITVGGAAADAVLLNASPASVPSSGGTVTIIASVVDAHGNRLANVPVSFSTDAGTLSATVATTDVSGDARVQLTTNRQTVVTARAGGQTATVTIAVDTPLTITASPTSGTLLTIFTFTVTPAQGSGVQNVDVDFGDGQSATLGAITAPTPVSHQYATTGSKTVRATQVNKDGSSTTAVVVVGVN
jgi:hypothetical protein